MNRATVAIMILISLFIVTGSRIVRNTLSDSINTRLDSSEATLINELDARLYKDFHLPTFPTEVEVSNDSLQYRIYDDVVRIANNGEEIEMEIKYGDGSEWKGSLKGDIEVKEIDVVNLNNEIKVRLDNTTSRLIGITYTFYEDLQRGRVTMNRNFTRYLTVTR